MDGELDRHDEKILFDALKRDPKLRERWQSYQLIGAALKGETDSVRDITASVMDALQDEPVAFAPKVLPRQPWHRTALALAATLAGVAVVGWMALGPQDNLSPVRSERLAQRVPAAVQPVRQASRDMQEYLVAHQAHASSLQFRGGTENIRTVAAMGAVTAK